MAGLFYKRPPEATSSESLWVRMGLHLLVGTHNDSGRVYGNSSSHCRGLVSTIMSKDQLPENISRDSGIWRLDILPADSISIASNQISGLAPTGVDFFSNGKILELTTLINTDPQVQTKEFMLGIVKNISLKTQGEDGTFNEGEVTIDLNTNMAPDLLIPSYIDDIIDSGDEMNDTIALWQCWKNSEKTGLEFEPGGSCFSFRAEFLRRQELYESLHTVDYQNDPEIYQCRDENGEEAVCVRGELGPYNMPAPVPDTFKVQVVMNDFSNDMQRQYQDVEYLNLLSNYYDLYQNWKDRTVQVDTAQFPYDGLPYKTHEFSGCEAGDADCLASAIEGNYPRMPVVMQTNRPIFGVPLDRMIESTLPITFDYTASDQDVYDINAANWAFLSYLASQTFNVVTGNFIGLICDSVALVDDLHDVELAAEDDPLGSARASINRYSSSDPFYGLHGQDAFKFFMSGVPEQNTQVDTYGQKLNYAQIACDAANLASSGLQFAQNADSVLNLDYEELGTAADVYKIIGGTSTAIGAALIMAEAEDIVQKIREGDIDGARSLMKTSSNIDALNQGQDLFDDLDSLLAGYTDVGSAGNGNNVLKSNAGYLLGTDKKTRAEVVFERVGAVPVTGISVLLDRVKIISNYEEDDKAEIRLIPFVGVISDKPRVGEELQTLFNESEGIVDGDHPWNYLRFNDVADGDTLETPDTVLYSGGGYNTAAIYVELAVMEDDSLSVEDDDMIGIFSQTIKLEEIFNENAEFKWTFLGDSDYELKITEYPIYNSNNQLCLENPLSDDFERQKAHNQNRRPSALVSMTVKLTMGDISVLHPVVDTALDVGVMGAGRGTYSMEMKAVSEIPTSGFNRIFDVFQGNAIVGSLYDQLLTATIVSYGVAPYHLTNLFTYDVNDFSGDLLPIKEAMTASRSLATGFSLAGHGIVKELPLVQLLPGNRLLFAISHDQGAKIMIVRYTDAGEMSLESSVLVKDVNENPVYSLLNATLSPDRTRLLVPYVPADYGAASDKTIPVYPELNLYEIDGDTITPLSANSFGGGIPFTNVEFIDESHVAMLTRTLVFGSDGDAWWPDWETVQDTCSCDDLNCLFETVGKNILLFTINDSHRLELTDSRDIFYTPPYEIYLKDFIPLRMLLSMNDSNNDLQRVSTIEGDSSILRLGQKIFQLNLEPYTGDYYFGNSSSYQNTKSLRYNADGNYYCAGGITCSGFLRSALNPSRDDTNVFKSEDKIWTFEFADTDRDLALGIYGDKLQLLSLYDGAAYKGPQVTGDIFDTAVSVNSSDTLDFSFTVTDRDTPFENLTVEISVTTVEPSGYGETTVSQLSFAPNGDGGYDWTGSFSMGEFDNDTVLNETILVSISDGTYTSEQAFTIFHKPSTLITFADSTYGVEAWKTDGTTSGTKMLNDANTEGDSTYIGSTLYKFDHNYFYTGTTDNENYEPFIASTDGQAKPLKEGISGGAYTNFMAFEGLVYFKTKSGSGDSTLWKTNGTSVGTVAVKTISSGEIAQFFNFNNGLYFFVNGNNGGEDELWKSDGTSDGTKLVKGSLYYNNYASISNGKLFFSGKAYDGTQIGLWVSDGTTDGTGLLKEFVQLPSHLTDVGGLLYFQDFYQITNGDTITHMDLWKTDGSVPGTVLVKEDGRPYFLAVKQMFVCDDTLYFLKMDELWRSDGTGTGTVKVNTLYDLSGYNQIWDSIQVINNTLYFNIQFISPSFGYKIYAMHPKTSSNLIEVDPTLYDKITFYKASLGNNLIYSTQDADHYYLWAHNADDGKTLIQTTDR